MRRSFGRHDPLPWLTAVWHRNRFDLLRQRSLGKRRGKAAGSRPRRWAVGIGVAGVTAAALGLAALAWLTLAALPLEVAHDLSVTVLDRNGRLLRAYTTADGRWRLPLEPAQVDQRYLAMLIGFEDKRFYAHFGVDPWASGRALWQLARHGRIVSGGSTLTMQ